MLQAWALRVVLERMGHEVEFPICNHVGEVAPWLGFERKDTIFKTIRSFVYRILYNLLAIKCGHVYVERFCQFRQRNLRESDVAVERFSNIYDCIIVGSDQVWSAYHAEQYYPLFTGAQLDTQISLVSYAASYGDRLLTDAERQVLLPQLSRYTAVSVREKVAQDELLRWGIRDVTWVVDPTLLLTAVDYWQVEEVMNSRTPYLYVYWISGGNVLLRIARVLAKRLSVRLVVTPGFVRSRMGMPRGLRYDVSPGRMLTYVKQAKYVLAASFHGTVFGVLYKRPFLSFREKKDMVESRPASLLNRLGIPERLVTPEVPIEEMVRLLHEPIPEVVYTERLPDLRQQSLDWLKAALEKVEREREGMPSS